MAEPFYWVIKMFYHALNYKLYISSIFRLSYFWNIIKTLRFHIIVLIRNERTWHFLIVLTDRVLPSFDKYRSVVISFCNLKYLFRWCTNYRLRILQERLLMASTKLMCCNWTNRCMSVSVQGSKIDKIRQTKKLCNMEIR